MRAHVVIPSRLDYGGKVGSWEIGKCTILLLYDFCTHPIVQVQLHYRMYHMFKACKHVYMSKRMNWVDTLQQQS
jgi:hypothetical protein